MSRQSNRQNYTGLKVLLCMILISYASIINILDDGIPLNAKLRADLLIFHIFLELPEWTVSVSYDLDF